MRRRLQHLTRFMPGVAAIPAIVVWCAAPALASTGVSPQCPEAEKRTEVAEIVAPALTINVIEHGITSSAAIDEGITGSTQDSAAALPQLSSSTKTLLEEAFDERDSSADLIDSNEEGESPISEAPPTATRLPGVSEEDLPRFRRQMYRTDI